MKNSTQNRLLALAVASLFYGVLELLALPIFYYTLSPRANPMLDDGLPVLLQSTKSQLVPEHYVALAGDSYAMGLGDGYYQVAGHALARYGSTPYLQQLLDKDVISFGSAGNGSIAGMVTEPLSTLAYWQNSQRISLTSPDILLVFFYEGNDLNDNVEYLQRTSKKRLAFDYAQLHNRDYFQQYIQEVALNQDSLYQQSQQRCWYQQFYLARFIWRAVAHITTQLYTSLFPAAHATERSPLNPPGRFEWTEPGTVNQAFINKILVPLPDNLQGPSMDLTHAEKEIALVSFQEALHFLKKHLPTTRLAVVYIPSVITTYDIGSAQVTVQSHARRQQFVYDSALVKQQSDWMALQIQQLSESEQVPFIDPRPAIRTAGQQALLHGPLDWNHFNEHGYQVLAEAIAPHLATY